MQPAFSNLKTSKWVLNTTIIKSLKQLWIFHNQDLKIRAKIINLTKMAPEIHRITHKISYRIHPTKEKPWTPNKLLLRINKDWTRFTATLKHTRGDGRSSSREFKTNNLGRDKDHPRKRRSNLLFKSVWVKTLWGALSHILHKRKE